jgi:tryptophan halogenase
LFKEASWFAVLSGQGHRPRDYNPLIDAIDSGENLAHLGSIKAGVRAAVAKMPEHAACLVGPPRGAHG